MLSWVRSIACYTIAVSLLMGIVPEGNYKKYVKFFMGLLLSLLLLSPAMELFGLDALLAANYEDLLSGIWKEQRGVLEEQERKQEEACLQALICQTIDPLGYSLNQFRYKEAEDGSLAELTVWVTEGKEENHFAVPAVIVEEISISSLSASQPPDEEGKTGLEDILAAVCGLEAECVHIVENKK